MKLVRFSTNGQSPRVGVLQGDHIADLQASLAASLARRGVVRAQDIAATLVPASTREFLEGGAATQDAIAAITEWVTVPAASRFRRDQVLNPFPFRIRQVAGINRINQPWGPCIHAFLLGYREIPCRMDPIFSKG